MHFFYFFFPFSLVSVYLRRDGFTTTVIPHFCDIEFHTEKVGRKRHLGMAQTELTESKFSL